MTKLITRAEVAEHNSRTSTWFVIGNKVYDVSKFLDEHPGGCEVLLEQAGKDATETFEDVGHSTDARQMKEDYLVGEIVPEEKQEYSYDKRASWNTQPGDNKQRGTSNGGIVDAIAVPALIAIVGLLLYYIFF